jgi:hypothetical protein
MLVSKTYLNGPEIKREGGSGMLHYICIKQGRNKKGNGNKYILKNYSV